MELVEAGQDLNRVLLLELLDAYGALTHRERRDALEIAVPGGLVLIPGLWLCVEEVGGQLVDDGVDSLGRLSIVIVVELRQHVVVAVVQLSPHRLQLKHLQIRPQQQQLTAQLRVPACRPQAYFTRSRLVDPFDYGL